MTLYSLPCYYQLSILSYRGSVSIIIFVLVIAGSTVVDVLLSSIILFPCPADASM